MLKFHERGAGRSSNSLSPRPEADKTARRRIARGRTYKELSNRSRRNNITLIRKRKQTTVIDLKTRGNNLKSLASIFQVATRFHPRHMQPKTLADSFVRHKYIFWLFKEMIKIHDRAPLM